MSSSEQKGGSGRCGRAMRLLVRGAGQVVRVAAGGEQVKLRKDMDDLAIINATVDQGVSVAVDE